MNHNFDDTPKHACTPVPDRDIPWFGYCSQCGAARGVPHGAATLVTEPPFGREPTVGERWCETHSRYCDCPESHWTVRAA